jgi:hypothetical protein
MKYNKDQVQKIILAVILGITGIYTFFNLLFNPLVDSAAKAKCAIKDLTPKIAEASKQIANARGLETSDPNSATAKALFEVMKQEIPDSVPVAWFPPRMSEFFRKQGIPKITSRFNADSPEADLPGFKSSNWAIEIQRTDFNQLAAAIANLENEEGLMQINNLQIEASPMEVGMQRAQLTVTTIVKQ